MSAPVAGPVERTGIPAARSIRRYTAEVARRRTGAGVGGLLDDVYYLAVLVAVAVLLAYGAIGALPVAEAPDHGAFARGTTLAGLVAVVVLALAGGVLGLAGRLGPVGAGGAESTWWLPLPVDRRGLLRGSAWQVPVVAGLVAGLATGVLVAAADSGRADGVLAGIQAGLLATVLGTSLVLLAGIVQQRFGSRAAAGAGDVVLAIAPVAAVAAVVAGWQPAGSVRPPWWAVGAGAGVLVLLAALLDTRLGGIPARSLREGGAVASHAAGALVSLDTRELSRALTDRLGEQSRRSSLRMRVVSGPRSAIVLADLLVLLRSPRHLVQLLTAAVVPWVVVGTPELAGQVQLAAALLVAGYLATMATAEGARRAELAPALDRLLPLSAKAVRTMRLVVPAVVMTVWTLVALGAVAVWRSDPAWLALALVAGPAWAAVAVRSAFRPAPDWSGPLVSTPMGALPSGAAGVLVRGPDAMLGLLPLVIALLIGSAPSLLLAVQLPATAAVLAWATSLETRSMMDRLAEAAGADSKRPAR